MCNVCSIIRKILKKHRIFYDTCLEGSTKETFNSHLSPFRCPSSPSSGGTLKNHHCSMAIVKSKFPALHRKMVTFPYTVGENFSSGTKTWNKQIFGWPRPRVTAGELWSSAVKKNTTGSHFADIHWHTFIFFFEWVLYKIQNPTITFI